MDPSQLEVTVVLASLCSTIRSEHIRFNDLKGCSSHIGVLMLMYSKQQVFGNAQDRASFLVAQQSQQCFFC